MRYTNRYDAIYESVRYHIQIGTIRYTNRYDIRIGTIRYTNRYVKTDPKPRKPRQSAGRGGARAAREVAEIDAEAEVKDTEEIVRDINEIIGPEGAPELNPNDPENRARIGVAKSAEKSKDHN